jgi:hypothetical protein
MKLKCPFPIKHLEDRLSLEKNWLKKFNQWLINGNNLSDDKLIEISKENINTCEHRIIELEDAILYLKTYLKTENNII